MWTILTTLIVATIVAIIIYLNRTKKGNNASPPSQITPVSVNYHFTRVCNYSCGFCFHTSIQDTKQPLDIAKRGLKLLKDAGMQKINFAGGEPFLYAKYLGELVRYCDEELHLHVSIVSNGSKITRSWFEEYAKHVAILAISCDSFDEEVNKKIGRGAGKKSHIEAVYRVKDLCKEFDVRFKLNTVVNRYNWREDMTNHIAELAPFRWKVFQVLVIKGENAGDNSKRDASEFVITDEEFAAFGERHKQLLDNKVMVMESNSKMQNSYLILDEEIRFLDCSGGYKAPSASILEVGVEAALRQSGFDEAMFHARGGQYDWSKIGDQSESSAQQQLPACSLPKNLTW